MTVIWCMVPQIWSATTFLSFWTAIQKMKKSPGNIIILQKCNINDNYMMYVSWDTEHDGQNFLSFRNIFCPFTPVTTQKIKIWKYEKIPRDIILLHMCTINDNHMMYVSWDMELDGQNFLSFWTILSKWCTRDY